MVHEPSGFLSNSQMTRNLATAHAILAVRHQPRGEHPLVHTERAILKDTADFNGELLFAALAKPNLAGRDEGMLFGVATRAGDAIGPAQRDSSSERLGGIAKVDNRILERGRKIDWKAAHESIYAGFTFVCQAKIP